MVGGDSYVDANPTVSGMQEGVNTLLNRWYENMLRKILLQHVCSTHQLLLIAWINWKQNLEVILEKIGVNLKIDFEAV